MIITTNFTAASNICCVATEIDFGLPNKNYMFSVKVLDRTCSGMFEGIYHGPDRIYLKKEKYINKEKK